jgi:hypothetical protein
MKVLPTIAFFLFFAANLFAQENIVKPSVKNEEEKIEFLISAFAALEGASFIYNEHKIPVADAVAYFHKKRSNMEKQGVKVKTAEDFVVKIASKSANTGHLYKYELPDGTRADVADFMMKILQDL